MLAKSWRRARLLRQVLHMHPTQGFKASHRNRSQRSLQLSCRRHARVGDTTDSWSQARWTVSPFWNPSPPLFMNRPIYSTPNGAKIGIKIICFRIRMQSGCKQSTPGPFRHRRPHQPRRAGWPRDDRFAGMRARFVS